MSSGPAAISYSGQPGCRTFWLAGMPHGKIGCVPEGTLVVMTRNRVRKARPQEIEGRKIGFPSPS
jgi:hypothetical protein